jgi:hypothetical protein
MRGRFARSRINGLALKSIELRERKGFLREGDRGEAVRFSKSRGRGLFVRVSLKRY